MGFGDIIQHYKDIINKYGDPRVENLPLMEGPLTTIAICLSYVYVSKSLGPKLMESRRPFKLKKILMFYNIIQVLWSAYAVYEGYRVGLMTSISMTCFPVDYDDSDRARTAVRMSYLYYVSKVVELLDTVVHYIKV